MYRGKFAFKIDWASLILERKFTVFLCFTLYLRAVYKYKPPPGGGGACIWRGLYMEGLIFGILRYDSKHRIDQKQQYSLDVAPLEAGPLQLIGQVILNKLQSTPDNSNPR